MLAKVVPKSNTPWFMVHSFSLRQKRLFYRGLFETLNTETEEFLDQKFRGPLWIPSGSDIGGFSYFSWQNPRTKSTSLIFILSYSWLKSSHIPTVSPSIRYHSTSILRSNKSVTKSTLLLTIKGCYKLLWQTVVRKVQLYSPKFLSFCHAHVPDK